MTDMLIANATDIRKNWSNTCDSVARVRPSFIKRTHDEFVMFSTDNMLQLLDQVKCPVSVYTEEDATFTISCDNIDLAENAASKEEAYVALANAILDYANEYYEKFSLYSKSPNRAEHLPVVTKALLLGDAAKIKEDLLCRSGRT